MRACRRSLHPSAERPSPRRQASEPRKPLVVGPFVEPGRQTNRMPSPSPATQIATAPSCRAFDRAHSESVSTRGFRFVPSRSAAWSSSVRQFAIKNSSGTDLYRRHDTVTNYTFTDGSFSDNVDVITSSTVDPNGSPPLTTSFAYYQTGAGTGKPGKLKYRSGPLGDFQWLDYDSSGRVTADVRPWKDQTFSDPPTQSQSHVFSYSYSAVDSNDNGTTHTMRPRST